MITKYAIPIITDQDKNLPVYVVTANIFPHQSPVYRPYGIEHHQLLYTLEGTGQLILNKKKYILKSNTLLYLPPNTIQHYYPLENWTSLFITYVSNIYDNYFTFNENIYFPADIEKQIELAKEIINIRDDINFCRKSSHLLYKLLLDIKNEIDAPGYTKSKIFLNDAHNYILNHYYEDIDISYLADMCGLNPIYFGKVFRQMYNIAPYAYIIQLRIQFAKKLLMISDTNINKISSMVGFKSPSHFVDVFKKHEKMTPSQFRELNHVR